MESIYRDFTALEWAARAMDAPSNDPLPELPANVTALTRENFGREGGIRTRDLSVPNARRRCDPQATQSTK